MKLEEIAQARARVGPPVSGCRDSRGPSGSFRGGGSQAGAGRHRSPSASRKA